MVSGFQFKIYFMHNSGEKSCRFCNITDTMIYSFKIDGPSCFIFFFKDDGFKSRVLSHRLEMIKKQMHFNVPLN